MPRMILVLGSCHIERWSAVTPILHEPEVAEIAVKFSWGAKNGVWDALRTATRQINAPKTLTTSAVRYGFPMN
jgi:hypothetical protein